MKTGAPEENTAYLTEQLITYIGNKRNLLNFLGSGLEQVTKRLGKRKLSCFDVFSGSGVVSRYFKQFASHIYANDLENYSRVINECYLTNRSTFNGKEFEATYHEIRQKLDSGPLLPGLIAQNYAPRNDEDIQEGERVFYTSRNARYLDTARTLIASAPDPYRNFLLAPLIAEASVHANTAGVFKGFYKNRDTGIGQFGGKNRDALNRILGNIELRRPVFSNFECDYTVLTGDANSVCQQVPEVDIAYLDPPYNQHPYGSNYFMLNLLVDYQGSQEISRVSGIPTDWKRSSYNKNAKAESALSELIQNIKARFLIISFNSEGFIPREQMIGLLEKHGKLQVQETRYNTFRASRNLFSRNIHLREYLYLLEKK